MWQCVDFCVARRTRKPRRNSGRCRSGFVSHPRSHAETAIYNGGSLWAEYWIETVTELRGDLISSGNLDEALIDRFLACCSDSNWWTQTIAFTAVHGRTLGG